MRAGRRSGGGLRERGQADCKNARGFGLGAPAQATRPGPQTRHQKAQPISCDGLLITGQNPASSGPTANWQARPPRRGLIHASPSPCIFFMTHYMTNWKSTREPAKTKAELREMLTEAVRNTRPEPTVRRTPKKVAAKGDLPHTDT
jgi:hypothetical protein